MRIFGRSIPLALAALAALSVVGQAQSQPITPIQHVIVVFGENRSFDHVFGTYVPRRGQIVWNLLSLGIVNRDGTPGPNYARAHQFSASVTTTYSISPGGKTLYQYLPDPLAGGNEDCDDTYGEPFCTESIAISYEPNLDPAFNPFLITGATGLPTKTPDTRITNVSTLLPGPFQLTNALPPSVSTTLTYDDYAASPVHRFYQMWQQTDCSKKTANPFNNPSGCASDLFPWVETTIGAGSNGKKQLPICDPNDITPHATADYLPLPCFSYDYLPGATTTGEGSTSMGFYNANTGDNPYLTELANKYTLLDNLHQSIMGGTGPNHIALGYADAMWYSDGKGHPLTPPSNQIEDPNPQPHTNNWYAQDGYSGGSYTACADPTQPGVAPITKYLKSLSNPRLTPNCDRSHYYLLNNYNPGYYFSNGNGVKAPLGPTVYTIPPTSQPHIGDVLEEGGLTYTFFGEDWNIYAGLGCAVPIATPTDPNPPCTKANNPAGDPLGQNPKDAYCNICNPFQYATDIMTDKDQVAAHIADMTGPNGFYTQLAAGKLPNVSIIQPSGFADGHPASSKIDLWEGFVKNIIESVKATPLWDSTAIFLVFDEGGGYYDSGYIQPLDFFGDGTRMASLIVSPYAAGGKVYHGYADHVSIDKFIERNWNLPPISNRSRDNLPNPKTSINPYVPLNSPAIDDLFGAFDFPHH
jgi:phospholipase C